MRRVALLCVAIAGFGLGSYYLMAKPAANPVVVMETSMGTIEIELDPDKAPVTVKNFVDYANDKFFDGTIFHRVIEDFMIQGGGFEPGLKEKKTKKPIKNEAGNGLSNVRGTIAMARTDNPDSATAQFYINVADNSRTLDKSDDNPGYCVFGKVTKGMDVVDKIRKVQTRQVIREVKVNDQVFRVPYKDVPVKDVIIKSVRVKK
jgi:cyclophilin family peptidyl-prolyl cis-trans isomerase